MKECLDCHSLVEPKKVMPGSILIEIILYFVMILPGIIYSLWRNSAAKMRCPECGSERLKRQNPNAKVVGV